MKTIGLIGGMSWESTRVYYELVNRGVQARLGGLHSARVILSSLDFAPIAALQRDARWHEAGELLAREAERLERAGADIVALATNTMHKCADQVIAALSVPFLHIADPLIARLRAEGRKCPLLLGTRFTMEDRFILDRLEAAGLQPSVPDAEDRAAVHGIIYDELCKGIVSQAAQAAAKKWVSVAAAGGADSVILGCTEICLLIAPGSVELPVYDTAAIHAEALVDYALR